MFQIVVPTELQVAVLKTAHIARDIIAFIKTCHTYQVTGKPNQSITLVPLQNILVASQRFGQYARKY